MLEHFDGVVTCDADVAELRGLGRKHEPTHSRAMHFYAEVIPFRVSGGERRKVLAIAEADLHDTWRASTEERIEIEPFWRELHAELGPGLFERALLAFSDTAGASDK